MKYYLKERDALESRNAGSKARNDVETIVEQLGFRPVDVVLPYKPTEHLLDAVAAHLRIYRFFRKQLSSLQNGDELLVQFPPRSHSILFPRLYKALRRRGVKVAFLIHDLERMRYSRLADVRLKKRIRILLEESRLIKVPDTVICHNDKMKGFLEQQGIPAEKLVPLGIFDYLTDCPLEDRSANRPNDPVGNRVIIAGNLSPEKCVYIGSLQDVPGVTFDLYGVGYEDLGQPNVSYHGAFQPDELVGKLEGDFGLVWDGTSVDTCTGIFGNYLRLNDPHKLSLYLTAGLPVIVWEEAAVADFVKENGVGLTVASLKDIANTLTGMTPDDYQNMAKNAARISKLLRDGHYLKTALRHFQNA